MINRKEILSLLKKYVLTVIVGLTNQPVINKQIPVSIFYKRVNSKLSLINLLCAERQTWSWIVA